MLNVEYRPPADIKPYEKNPRINDAAVDAVAESIRRFGFRQPIVVDEAGVIVCGHTRWKAAQKLGLSEVPVHVARDLTPEQIRAYQSAAEVDFGRISRGRATDVVSEHCAASRRQNARPTPYRRN